MDHESQVAIPPWLNVEAISEFIDELRLAGYKIGVDQHLAVQKLLLGLTARGVQFTEPIQLANYLGPVICTSPAEQHDFQNRFARWIEPNPDVEAADSLAVELNSSERQWLWFRRSLIVIVLLIVTFFASQVAPILQFLWNIWYVLGLILLTLLITIAWRRWWFYRAELFLERHARTTQPEIEKVSVQGLREQIVDDRFIFSVAQAFRRRVEKPIPMLDVERTLNRSLAQGGWFTPVFDRRQIRPEYLFLVDRTNHQDQQAKLAETLIHSLQEYDVLAVIYYFDGDPRLCVAATSERAWSLPELVNKYEEYRLILFTDGAQFFNPLSGEFEPWIEYLQRWAIRVILTPVAPARWHYREEALAKRFTLFPATADGLAQFMQVTPTQTTILAQTEQMNASYPTELEARPLIWIQRDPPEITQIDEMLIALRQYLGINGFYWLSACAVYPALNWNLTLYLGATLRGENGEQLLGMRYLADLIHLPWFRYGYIPDWLRTRLLIDLVPEQDQAIRSTLEALLITAICGEIDEFQLEIARDHQWMIATLVKPLLHIIVKNAAIDSPLHDYVFLTFMTGRWQSKLVLRAPNNLRTLFVNRDQQTLNTHNRRYAQSLARNQMIKRSFDLVLCLLALPTILPLICLCGLLIWLDNPGPIFFKQFRTGKGGKRFKVYKLRTMATNAEELKLKHEYLNELTWPDFKITNDPRVTRIGRILRRTGLDELPQVFNILKGDMSWVGPRATWFDVSTYSLWHTERLGVLPGFTGLWQVRRRSNLDFDEQVLLDIEYIERQSLWLDIQILFQTIIAIFTRKLSDS